MAIEAPPNPSLRAVDDLALMRRVADRRPEALAELYDRYAPLLLGVARRIVGGAFEAEEVLVESFLQAWAQAPRVDPGRASVSTWLALIARGRGLERRRARPPGERAAVAPAAEPNPLGDAARAEESAPHAERRERVRATLGGLPDEQRRVLELAFWEGLAPTEIAARTGAPREAVRATALLAMKRVRQALREQIRELM